MYAYTDMLMYTLPSPRYNYYENSDYTVIQDNVLGKVNEVIGALGFYPVASQTALLASMKITQNGVLLLGLIFSVLIILFVGISTLLIYSLLLATVEKKTFTNGVLRLVGLRKIGFIVTIIFQSTIFVIPSLVVGTAGSIPALYYLYEYLFTENMGF